MSAASTRSFPAAGTDSRGSTERVTVLVCLALVVLLAGVLIAASVLPSTTLVGRLMGAAGDARTGPFTQDLFAHIGERLRLAAGLLIVLAAGLFVLRAPFEELVRAVAHDRRALSGLTRAELVQIGATMVLAACVRLAFLSQPMRYDEAMTFNEFASRPLYYGLSFYPDPNNHLLNTLLVHVAFVGLGNEPWVLRLPALIAGVLLVPATYMLARALHGRRTALLSALLVATSSYLVEYSTNSRGYTLQALCFVGTLTLVVFAARRDSRSALALAAVVAALGAYALPTMLYGIVVAAVWLALESRQIRLQHVRLGHVAVCVLIIGLLATLLYLPVVLVSGPDKLVMNRFVLPLTISELVRELPVSLAHTWTLWHRDVAPVIGGLLVLGFLVSTFGEARQKRVPLGALAVGVCLIIVLMQRVAPFERVWLFLLPVYFMVCVDGLVRLSRGRLGAPIAMVAQILVVGVLALTTFTSGSVTLSPETGRFPDAEDVARTLAGRLAPGDAVLTSVPASEPELQYYFPRSGLPSASLVRPPDQAQHLYLVALPDTVPVVPGWVAPQQIAQFNGSVLLVLARAADTGP